MENQPELLDLTNAVEWSLVGYQLHLTDIELILQRNRINGEFLSSPLSICKLKFERIVSFAIVELSLMWLYFGDDEDNPPAVQAIPYDGKLTFIDGFTLNTELCTDWKHVRVSCNSEVLDVITRDMPIITQLKLDHFEGESAQ